MIRVGPPALSVCTVAALCCAATAVAAPPDEQPAEPVPASVSAFETPTPGTTPRIANIGSVLAQAGSTPTGPLGLPDLSAYAPAVVLAQNAVPSPPGDPGTPALPSLNAFNPGYLIGQNASPAAPREGTPLPGLGPSAEDPGTGRLAFLRRLHEMYAGGQLKGALLGQQPAEAGAS